MLSDEVSFGRHMVRRNIIHQFRLPTHSDTPTILIITLWPTSHAGQSFIKTRSVSLKNRCLFALLGNCYVSSDFKMGTRSRRINFGSQVGPGGGLLMAIDDTDPAIQRVCLVELMCDLPGAVKFHTFF